jgi:predicted PurR-regulated permease PerM
MATSGVRMVIMRKAPLSEKIIQAALYAVLAGVIAVFLKEPVDGWIAELGIPFRSDLLTTMVSIFIAIFLTTLLLGLMARHYTRRGVNV